MVLPVVRHLNGMVRIELLDSILKTPLAFIAAFVKDGCESGEAPERRH